MRSRASICLWVGAIAACSSAETPPGQSSSTSSGAGGQGTTTTAGASSSSSGASSSSSSSGAGGTSSSSTSSSGTGGTSSTSTSSGTGGASSTSSGAGGAGGTGTSSGMGGAGGAGTSSGSTSSSTSSSTGGAGGGTSSSSSSSSSSASSSSSSGVVVPPKTWDPAFLVDDAAVSKPPSVGLDAAGNAIVAWSREASGYSAVVHRHYAPATGWAAMAVDKALGSIPALSMSDDGRAVLACATGTTGTSQKTVWVSRYDPAAGWLPSTDQYVAATAPSAIAVHLSQTGPALVTWRVSAASGGSEFWARRHYFPSAAGPALMATYTSQGTSWVAGTSPNNGSILFWEAGNTIYYKTSNAMDTTWSTAGGLNTSVGQISLQTPALGVRNQRAYVVWEHSNGGLRSTKAVFGGQLYGLDTIQPSMLGGVRSPSVGVDDSENAVVVWLQRKSTPYYLYGAHTTSVGVWTEPELLATLQDVVSAPRIAVDSTGNAVATWATTYVLYAARYVAGAGWQPSVPLTPLVANINDVRVAASNGNAVVVWRQGAEIYARLMH